MKPTVYLETTIPSYLTGWPSRSLVRAGQQQITRDWWSTRDRYELVVSALVLSECAAGDAEAAADRLRVLEGVRVLSDLPAADELTDLLVREVPFPAKALSDARHIASATVHGVRFLVSWNFRHILNAVLRPRVDLVCRQAGYEPSFICTPAELLAEEMPP